MVPPSAPEITRVTRSGRTATIAFSPPASQGSAPVASYWVTARPRGGGATISIQVLRSPAVLDGLSPTVEYDFLVQAQNPSGGLGPPDTATVVECVRA